MCQMAKPLVGITTYVTPAAFGAWELEAALIPYDYVRAVERAGGRAVLVPPSDDGIEEILDAVDGLDLLGRLRPRPRPLRAGAASRDDGDRAGARQRRARAPRGGARRATCRCSRSAAGSQILNVALGGDLVQHLPDHVGHDGHKEAPGVFSEHDVEIEPGTRLAGLLGDRVPIKSHHHQGFARLGEGLRPSARDEDGWVEALEVPDRRFALGVLWHPEAGEDRRLFEALVAEAAAYRSRAAVLHENGYHLRCVGRLDARGASAQGPSERRRAAGGHRPPRRAGLLPDRAGDLRPAARVRAGGSGSRASTACSTCSRPRGSCSASTSARDRALRAGAVRRRAPPPPRLRHLREGRGVRGPRARAGDPPARGDVGLCRRRPRRRAARRLRRLPLALRRRRPRRSPPRRR